MIIAYMAWSYLHSSTLLTCLFFVEGKHFRFFGLLFLCNDFKNSPSCAHLFTYPAGLTCCQFADLMFYQFHLFFSLRAILLPSLSSTHSPGEAVFNMRIPLSATNPQYAVKFGVCCAVVLFKEKADWRSLFRSWGSQFLIFLTLVKAS